MSRCRSAKLRLSFLLRTAILWSSAAVLLGILTWRALAPMPTSLALPDPTAKALVLAADGTVLSTSFTGNLNRTTEVALTEIPLLIRQAFITAEDKRYWEHNGVDWLARLSALKNNLAAGKVQRGASSIGEQSARLLHGHPRTYWGHWLAGWDAQRLIRKFGHAEVLNFYLNQVPYAAQRRGVVQAAEYYFSRDLAALNPAQQLALAVIVRSPRRYDPSKQPQNLRNATNALAERMVKQGIISPQTAQAVYQAPLVSSRKSLSLAASPFVVYVRQQAEQQGILRSPLVTTLDTELQQKTQHLLQQRLQALASLQAHNAAALVVDNHTGSVLAWATAPYTELGIDPVITPRQPGSALKPFIYAQAMEELGWQPDHLLDDSPLLEQIEDGVHHFRNYSGAHHGPVSLRYALGNSLNIPAVRTAQALGIGNTLNLLQRLGITSLNEPPSHYGAAIALGDGAVSLFELTQAYATLARRGDFLPLQVLANSQTPAPHTVFSAPVASLISHILADTEARQIEFGAHSVLNMPHPTAAKTGTSSNYRDAWAFAYDDQYTVGVWMGRLAGGPMQNITGALGAAPVVRQIFTHLRSQAPYAGLWLSPELKRVPVCEALGNNPCTLRQGFKLPHTEVDRPITKVAPMITRPINGERFAIDPRVPLSSQRLQLRLSHVPDSVKQIIWQVNNDTLIGQHAATAEWPLRAGDNTVSATLMGDDGSQTTVSGVRFYVEGLTP